MALLGYTFSTAQPWLLFKAVKNTGIYLPLFCLNGSMKKIVTFGTHVVEFCPNSMMHRQKLKRSKKNQKTFGWLVCFAPCEQDAPRIKNFQCPVQVPAAKRQSFHNWILSWTHQIKETTLSCWCPYDGSLLLFGWLSFFCRVASCPLKCGWWITLHLNFFGKHLIYTKTFHPKINLKHPDLNKYRGVK